MNEYVEKCEYINSIGQKIVFGENGLYLDESAISGWKFSYETTNDSIKSFHRGIYPLPLNAQIIAGSVRQANEIRNNIHDVAIVDIDSNVPGTFKCRGYEIKCWINEAEHSEYTEWNAFETLKLSLITNDEYWIQKEKFKFIDKGEGPVLSETGLDFVCDFPFDLFSESYVHTIENSGALDTDFILKIYGLVENPSVYINNHLYEVNVFVDEGDCLEIDSKERTIRLICADGKIKNCFSNRNRDSDVFKSLPSGKLQIYSDYEINLDLILYHRRSEPKWI